MQRDLQHADISKCNDMPLDLLSTPAFYGCGSANANNPDWIDWASKKADWFDPTGTREDEFFGK